MRRFAKKGALLFRIPEVEPSQKLLLAIQGSAHVAPRPSRSSDRSPAAAVLAPSPNAAAGTGSGAANSAPPARNATETHVSDPFWTVFGSEHIDFPLISHDIR